MLFGHLEFICIILVTTVVLTFIIILIWNYLMPQNNAIQAHFNGVASVNVKEHVWNSITLKRKAEGNKTIVLMWVQLIWERFLCKTLGKMLSKWKTAQQ